MPIAEGAFVRTLFPTHETPRRPGSLHICYCLAVARPLALLAYTTSRPWPQGTPTPFGVRVFAASEAASLNQRPFVFFLNRIAKLPLSERWFPDFDEPSQGVVATAPLDLRNEIYEMFKRLMRERRDLIQRLGPN